MSMVTCTTWMVVAVAARSGAASVTAGESKSMVTCITWLVAAVVVAALLWLARRRGWILSGRRFAVGSFLPSSPPSAGRTARIVETTVLGASAAVIIAIAATWRSTGGLMLMLDELHPQYATVNVIMFVCAVAGAAVALLITLLGRTAVGAIVMAVVLIGYGLVLNGGSYPGSQFLPKQMTEPVVEYTIYTGGTNVEGAELWVNDVHLGKTPYVATLDDFEAKVPYWPQPPADYETDKVEIPRYGPRGTYTAVERRWIKFQLPAKPSWTTPGPGNRRNRERKTYYARVCYAGQWGVAGGGRGSGGGGGRLTYRANSHFDVIFPQRQKRLDTLLNKARLADYHVGPEWYEAIETYDEDGWIALRKAADDEPKMMKVLDAWANWRYGLDKVADEQSAWKIFERIQKEADERRQYLTSSVAGRAVELLVPKLPRQRLLDRADTLIRKTGSFGYFKWQMNGRLQFGYSQRPGGLYLGVDSGSSNFSGGKVGSPQLAMSGYPVAHAVWMLYEIQPTVVRERIAPEIVRWQYRAGRIDPLLAAVYFGGDAIDKFLLRQNWHAEPSQLEWEEQLRMSGKEANKWLYLLAYLNDEAGREFRRKHTDAVMNLADKFYEDGYVSWNARIDFVFMDPWLAKKYWPRFARLARQESPHYALETQWRYLLEMGKTATADMFVDAWKETNIHPDDFQQAAGLLDQLGPETQAEVVGQLVELVEELPENISRVLKDFDSSNVVSILEAHAHGDKQQREAAGLYRDLQEGSASEQQRLRKNIPLWLAHTQPDSPLVAMLAESDDPDLRLMVIGALREHPTPQHQRLLEQLLEDPAPAVRAAAKNVAAYLRTLAAESPARYASDVPSSTRTTSTTTNQGDTK